MSDPDHSAAPPPGVRLSGSQLTALSNAIVGLHRRYYGRGATKARTHHVHDDLVLVELSDAYLTVERTLLARGQEDTVRHTRMTFQQAMANEFIVAVEEIIGRKVQSYVSQTFVNPEILLEIFYLEPADQVEERKAREAAEDAGEIMRPYAGLEDHDQ